MLFKSVELLGLDATGADAPEVDGELAGHGDDRFESPASPCGLRYGLLAAPVARATLLNKRRHFLSAR